MLEHLTLFTSKQADFLKFLKVKYHLYHLSNVFFRDLHFGVMSYLEWKNKPLSYPEAEELTRKLIGKLESDGVLKNVDRQAFLLKYPDFKKPAVKPAAPAAKPASPVIRPVAPTIPVPVALPTSATESKDPSQPAG